MSYVKLHAYFLVLNCIQMCVKQRPLWWFSFDIQYTERYIAMLACVHVVHCLISLMCWHWAKKVHNVAALHSLAELNQLKLECAPQPQIHALVMVWAPSTSKLYAWVRLGNLRCLYMPLARLEPSLMPGEPWALAEWNIRLHPKTYFTNASIKAWHTYIHTYIQK